ncbi:MAG: CoA-binding protein [Sandaracinaceae bacterium]
MAEHLVTRERIEPVLRNAKTIAVLGAHVEPSRPACYVPEYLAAQGYRVIGVNPRFAGRSAFGHPMVATLAEIGEPVDIVDVFRRSSDVAAHLEEILAMRPLPRTVWLQLGIRDEATADALIAQGIDVVQDRCTLADHRRWIAS